ncbi:MAG: hypothetical protein LBJ71_03140 [Holosporaceae bacterium]|jgi:hypothetical protein|nr:hypothetical protein [Holosporaceae bacterium]
MWKKCFGIGLFMTVVCCVHGQSYEDVIFTSQGSTNEPNIVQKSDKIFINDNNKVSLSRHIVKQTPGEAANPLKTNINSFFSSNSVDSLKLINDVMQKGECVFLIPVPKKGTVKFTVRSQPTFDYIKDALGIYRRLPQNIAAIGDRLAVLIEFFSQHPSTDPETIDLLRRNIHTFTIAVAILLQERCPQLKIELGEDGSLSALNGSSPLKHKLSELEVSYLNVREKENFKYGDSVDLETIASKFNYFLKEESGPLNKASRRNLYSNLPGIYQKFGEAISKIPNFQNTSILFATKNQK